MSECGATSLINLPNSIAFLSVKYCDIIDIRSENLTLGFIFRPFVFFMYKSTRPPTLSGSLPIRIVFIKSGDQSGGVFPEFSALAAQDFHLSRHAVTEAVKFSPTIVSAFFHSKSKNLPPRSSSLFRILFFNLASFTPPVVDATLPKTYCPPLATPPRKKLAPD